MKLNNCYNEDCLDGMNRIADKSIDMVLCDLPYQVTSNQKWDVIIPFDKLWMAYERIVKDNGAIVLFATEPFRTDLICSNRKLFKYDLIWEKNKTTGFLNAKKQPLRAHESILVFYKNPPAYNPQKTVGHKPMNLANRKAREGLVFGKIDASTSEAGTTERYPTSILKFPVVNNDSPERIHTAQKPVELLEFLIKSYSNVGETILDNCAGSGSTLIAAKNTGRNFIGFEKEKEFFDKLSHRLQNY